MKFNLLLSRVISENWPKNLFSALKDTGKDKQVKKAINLKFSPKNKPAINFYPDELNFYFLFMESN